MKINKARVGKVDVLFVDEIPQSTYPPTKGGYWRHMVPEEFKGKHVLILGVAGGTIARLLLKKYPKLKITGVDNNSLVMSVASQHFRVDEIKMKIIIEDAFGYVKRTRKKFDLILVDIWDGFMFPFKVLSSEFVGDCKKILNENGQIYINTPNLDFLAMESLKGGLRDDIGRNIIYRLKLTKEGESNKI